MSFRHKQKWWIEAKASGIIPLEYYISTTTMRIDTKSGSVVTYQEGLPSMKSHGSLITRSIETT